MLSGFLPLHSTCYLSYEQKFCLNSFSQAWIKSVSFNQLLTSFSPCFVIQVPHSALGSQQNWTFTFLALPLSPCLSFTIPLSCLFFPVHPCLYCKLSTQTRCAQGFTRVSLELKGVCVRTSDLLQVKVKITLCGKDWGKSEWVKSERKWGEAVRTKQGSWARLSPPLSSPVPPSPQ